MQMRTTCLRRQNSYTESVPRPEQQRRQRRQRRCEAITCLSRVGKLARANFSRSAGQEVARTSGRLGGARARARPPTPVLLPGESQGQQSLVGCRLWGHTVHARGEGERVLALESREGTRASRRVEEGPGRQAPQAGARFASLPGSPRTSPA